MKFRKKRGIIRRPIFAANVTSKVLDFFNFRREMRRMRIKKKRAVFKMRTN